ncbi:MAG: hypothetical protein HC879_03365 [Leptolyngbyaceae cyanobacterium SL_5_9]|nr:hypothetical protein [Leptolyngbyaceae cyanobacterium SL_5_9]
MRTVYPFDVFDYMWWRSPWYTGYSSGDRPTPALQPKAKAVVEPQS